MGCIRRLGVGWMAVKGGRNNSCDGVRCGEVGEGEREERSEEERKKRVRLVIKSEAEGHDGASEVVSSTY